MAALTAAGAVVAIPVDLGPVPITPPTLFAPLAGLIPGPGDGAAAMLPHLLAGAAGLPVFAGFKSGLAVLAGPTGGFILGFVPAAAVAGLARRTPPTSRAAVIGLRALAARVAPGAGVVQLSPALGMGKRPSRSGRSPSFPAGS